MIKLFIKALSVNALWKGKRFKTIRYKQYEQEVIWNLVNKICPPILKSEKVKLVFFLRVGLSSVQADLSNTIKALEDILQIKYEFNDNQTFLIIAEKEIVKKNEEYIELDFYEYTNADLGENIRQQFFVKNKKSLTD